MSEQEPTFSTHLAAEAPGEAEVVPAVRAYLAEVRGHLEALHRRGASGREVNAKHSDLTDQLIQALYQIAWDMSSAGDAEARLAVVALGGYARREMAIHSDVDLLFLHPRPLGEAVKLVTERIQYWLWDAGLQVGCATRGVAGTRKLAAEDVTVLTALLDARLLVGDEPLCEELRRAIREDVLRKPAPWIRRIQEAMNERHMQYGESLYLLQPNVKEGAGGLRDFHAACWVTVAAHETSGTLSALAELGLLTDSEKQEFRAAVDFLWRLRNELHLDAGRKNDSMSFEQQELIARAFGYGDRPESGKELPVERFMGDYYRHARAIRNYSQLVIEQCLAHVVPRRRPRFLRGFVKEVGDGFRVVDDHLEIPDADHLRERPVRLLTAFAAAQEYDVELSRTAQRLIRENVDVMDDAFRRDPEAVEAFLSILEGKNRVARTLMTMNENRVLASFIPEWDHIVCRWQHVIFHTYTVDVHSIFLVEQLRRLGKKEYQKSAPDLSELIHEATDKSALFLACLFHDLGKGYGGDHSEAGYRLTQQVLERFALGEERSERVGFLVKYHLLMSHLAQRRDLSDPKLIVEFARVVGDRENLRNLYLLTFADMCASSSSAWTDWKGFLLRELFERTSEFLETGGDDPERASEQIERRVEVRREAAQSELQTLGVGDGKINEYFRIMPRRYFIAHTPRQIARHAMVVFAFKPEGVIATSVRAMRGGFSEFIVVTQDMHGLYAKVAGSLTANRVNILGSHVYTTRTGLALEIYRVTTPTGGADEQQLTWQSVEDTLKAALGGELEIGEQIRSRARPVGTAKLPQATPSSVHVSNEESDFYTIVDVAADDRRGLLYDLTDAIAEQDLEIYISKASTILDQVADTFYLKDRNGNKLRDPERLKKLRRAIRGVLQMDGVGDGSA